MVALYRRQAKTAAEAKLGWFYPLHEIVPELAELDAARDNATSAKSHDRRGQ